jgi:hypothetical protein
MKTKQLIVCWAFGCGLLCSGTVPAQVNEVNSVDVKKIQAEEYLKFIEHIFWYPKETLDAKKISKESIPADMQNFKDMLKKVLRPEYSLSDQIIDANALAVESLRDDGDYILLEYKRNNRRIQIHDCKALLIAVFPQDEGKTKQSDVVEYVKSEAFRIMNLPNVDEKGNPPRVSGGRLGVGESMCGNLIYKASYPPPKFWYSGLRWWSDGRRILFLFGRGEGMSKRAGPAKDSMKPRKFKKVTKPDK